MYHFTGAGTNGYKRGDISMHKSDACELLNAVILHKLISLKVMNLHSPHIISYNSKGQIVQCQPGLTQNKLN